MRLRSVLFAFFIVTLATACAKQSPAVAPKPTATAAAVPATAKPVPTATPFDLEPGDPNFPQEAWRMQTIARFGPEERADGTKRDYVKHAEEKCAASDHPAYAEGSLEAYILETFC